MRDIVERLGQIADDLDGGSYPDSYPGDCMEAACEIRALRHKLAAADLLRDLAAEQSMKHAGTVYDLRQQLEAAEALVKKQASKEASSGPSPVYYFIRLHYDDPRTFGCGGAYEVYYCGYKPACVPYDNGWRIEFGMGGMLKVSNGAEITFGECTDSGQCVRFISLCDSPDYGARILWCKSVNNTPYVSKGTSVRVEPGGLLWREQVV